MSKFDELITQYSETLKGVSKTAVNIEQLAKVAKALGPSIYLNDASTVACTEQKEMDRIKANFLVKKLGMTDDAAMDAAVKSVCAEYKSNQKVRAVFHYLLLQKVGKTL